MDVEEHRARRITRIGHVASAKLEDEPGIDRAEGQFAALRTLTCTLDVVERPLHLGAGKIGIENEAGLLLDCVGVAGFTQCVADRRGAAVLPDDGAGNRFTRLAVPQHRGFALVGDADGGDVLGRQSFVMQGLLRHGELRLPDFVGVVLDPARMGEMLGEFLLRDAGDGAIPVEQDGARAGGALVQGQDVLGHGVGRLLNLSVLFDLLPVIPAHAGGCPAGIHVLV